MLLSSRIPEAWRIVYIIVRYASDKNSSSFGNFILTIELLAALRSPRKANDAMCTDDLHNLGQSAFNCKPLISSCDIRGIEYSPAPLRRSAFVTRMGVYVSLRALIDAAQDTERCIPYEQPL
jgi:hypothetical protein